MKQHNRLEYLPTFGEELGNAVSHGVMALAMLILLPFSTLWSYRGTTPESVENAIGASIFVTSVFLMFLASTLYHSMSHRSLHKQVFRTLDHICIYLAIAGSYTPIALTVIGGWQGRLIVIIQWTMVLFGIIYKSLSRRSIPALSLTIYLIMGWSILLFFPRFIRNASSPLLVLIAAGGILYTIGAWVYAKKGFKYHHLVWHLLINMAVTCHFVAIVFFMH